MNIEKLKARRQKLLAALKTIEEKIAQAERQAREQEQKKIMKLLQERGIGLSELSAILEKDERNQDDQQEHAVG